MTPYLGQRYDGYYTVCVLLHAVDLRHGPDPFEKMLREGGTVVADEDVLWTRWHMMHAVLEESFVHALDILVYRAHFGWPNKLRWKSQPCILIALARVVDEFDWIVVLAIAVILGFL
jgi:hypothetical protein